MAIARGESHDNIYECVTGLILQMAQCRVNEMGSFIDENKESVIKLVTSW